VPEKQFAMRQKTRNIVACLLIFGVVAALYTPALRHPFFDYDDEPYVADNPQVRAGLWWETGCGIASGTISRGRSTDGGPE
jgi:hypothetical protein